jgi:hypothetical protein
MADFTIPGTWTPDGDTPNQSIFRVDGHTAKENYLVIFDRKVSVAVNGTHSKPSFRIRIIRSHVNADDEPLSTKTVGDTTFSWPTDIVDIADVKEVIALMGSILSDAELPSDIADDLIIPRA